MSTINQRIRELREHLGLGRTEFAELVGTNRKRLQNVERGLQKPPSDLLEAIASEWPQYSVWLLTGQTPKESVQISPVDHEEQLPNKTGKRGEVT